MPGLGQTRQRCSAQGNAKPTFRNRDMLGNGGNREHRAERLQLKVGIWRRDKRPSRQPSSPWTAARRSPSPTPRAWPCQPKPNATRLALPTYSVISAILEVQAILKEDLQWGRWRTTGRAGLCVAAAARSGQPSVVLGRSCAEQASGTRPQQGGI